MPKDDWLKLAILYDKNAIYSPSNSSAIDRFCESAISHKIYPTILGQNDISLLSNFDGLFIRDTTHPGNQTFEFALEAERIGNKVIDNSTSIMQGCNKIWQAEMFSLCNIPHPKTYIVSRDARFFDEFKDLTFPCVLKIPDSCFSQGVFKIESKVELNRMISQLNIPTLICQEFMETRYDWRITIFNHQFLFAVKYFMVDQDWKIIKYDRKGNYIDGKHECVRLEDVPPHVLAVADKCNKFLTDGLYGIDIKEIDGKAYCIEINDNPSIDAGVEDEIEGEDIYNKIISWYKNTS